MALETSPWDTAEVLKTPEVRAAYWDEALADFEQTGDTAFLQKDLTMLRRAMTMHGASVGEETVQSAREALAIAKGLSPAARSDQSGL